MTTFSALARWANNMKARFARAERLAADAGIDLAHADPGVAQEFWIRAE